MADAPLRTEDQSICTVTKQGDSWMVDVRSFPESLFVADRKLANQIFQLVKYAYDEGRDDAFRDLRNLIGA